MNKEELRKLEYALDRERSDCQAIISQADNGAKVNDEYLAEAQLGFASANRELRMVQRSLYGWRFVAQTYGDVKKFATIDIDALRARILDLKVEEAEHQWVLDHYEEDLAAAKEELETLNNALMNDIGFKPAPEDIQKAKDEILVINRKAGISKVALPEIKRQLEDLRRELEKLEGKRDKVFSRQSDTVYTSPGDEIDALAKEYAAKHGVTYARALHAVIEADPDLGDIYIRQDQLLT